MRRAPVSSVVALGLAALLALAGTLPAAAVAGEWSIPVTLSEEGQDATEPQVVTDGTTLTAIWRRYDGSNYRIQVASSTDSGATWSTPVTLSEEGQNSEQPQLVTDGTTLTAVWRRWDGITFRIQTSSYTEGDATWSSPVTISEAGQSALDPQVVTDGTTVTAVWTRSDGDTLRVQTSSLTEGDAMWSTPVTLSEVGQSAGSPQVVTDGTTLTAAWVQSDGGIFRIQASSFTDGDATWSPTVALSEAGQSADLPQVVTDGTTVTVTWIRFDGGNFRVQVSSLTAGDVMWSTPVTLSEEGQSASAPQVVTDGTTITVTWTRSDGGNDRVQVSSLTAGDVMWSTPATLSEEGQPALEPQVVADGTTLTVVWRRYDGSNYRVQVSSFAAGDVMWSTPVTLSEAGRPARAPQAVTDGTTLTVVWYRPDGENVRRIQAASTQNPAEEFTEPELAETGALEALAVGLLAGGLLLTGGVLVATRSRGRQAA